VHKDIICARSLLFKAMNKADPSKTTVMLAPIEGGRARSAFRVYLQYIYRTHRSVRTQINLEARVGDEQMFRCALWFLGQYLQDDTFTNTIMDILLQKYTSTDVVSMLIHNDVDFCLSTWRGPLLRPESGMWRWIVDCLASATVHEFHSVLHKVLRCDELKEAVMNKLLEQRGSELEGQPPTFADRELYYEHNVAPTADWGQARLVLDY
jgi:hypothetical protein